MSERRWKTCAAAAAIALMIGVTLGRWAGGPSSPALAAGPALAPADDAAATKAELARFEAAYRTQMENCVACHRAAGKEFLRLRIPERPAADVIDFAPDGAAGK